MRLNRPLLFLLLVSLTFPSGHCCRGRCTRETVVAVGSAVASSIVTGIVACWKEFHNYYQKQIQDASWKGFGWFAEKVKEKITEGKFQTVKLVRQDPPQHKAYINRSEELTQLKKLFDSFDTSTDDKVVYAVYLVGLPGSGKSELARQYGNLVFERGEVSTVITLNTESEGQFRDDLIQAIIKLKAVEATDTKKKDYNEENIEDLIEELQKLLTGRRPGWLLIVDNIRNTNITRRGFYKKLPNPGTKNWGKGYMLLTTQVFLLDDDKFVRIKKTNEGMTPNDAKQFLCELVRRGKGDCPDGDAEAIVKRLEYLPLAILAAGTFIERKLKLKSYTLAEYREHFDEENTKAFNISIPTKTDYPHSMQIALLLAVRNSVEGDFDASIVRDFCAFVGFTDEEETLSHLVQSYLEMKGHSEESIQKLIYFPLVDFLEDKKVFRVHQVTRDAFRAEFIERSTRHSARGDLLLENFQNISHFFFTRYDEKKVEIWGAPTLSYFRCVLTHHNYSLNEIISPDENLEVAASLIFKRLVDNWLISSRLFKCSYLEHFVARRSPAPENTEIIKELGIDSDSVIRFIQSVEPTEKEGSDRLYFSFLRVATVLYRCDTETLALLGRMFRCHGMLNGARVWFEEVVNRSCQSEGTGNQSSQCVEHLLDLGITYHRLEKYNAAEDILLQARQHSTTVREQDSSSWQSWPWLKYKVGCVLADVQIRLHKYSEALFYLGEVCVQDYHI